ncbi:hypothetical protein DRN97_08480 [Methanosarcinales archaeon]|nr:MAG: hypothetical protein DRN97_08480 [Methanosarcinales archaeon]
MQEEVTKIAISLGYWADISKDELEAHLRVRKRELLDLLLSGPVRDREEVEKKLKLVTDALYLLERVLPAPQWQIVVEGA